VPDKDSYPALEEAPILLPQPVPVTGAALSRSDQVRLAARARNTQRAYLGHWTRFRSWAQEQGLDLPGGLEAALCDYLVRLAEDGKRMATIRQARAAIIRGADLAGWSKPGGPGVAEMMRGLGRILRGPQRQAAPLHAEALAAIRATAFTRRRTRGGHTETAEYAQRRGLVDVALASVMRDGLLRVSEAAALRWRDVELAGDGSGRIRIPESKTDQEAEGVVLYLGPAAIEALLAIRPEEAVIDAVTPVFNLHPDTIRRRLQQAARAAGLPGWRDITGHSGRVGMAQDLSAAGFALPELMTAGRWKSPRMPARYTERQAAGRGAVARYYQGGRG
jgi:integrase